MHCNAFPEAQNYTHGVYIKGFKVYSVISIYLIDTYFEPLHLSHNSNAAPNLFRQFMSGGDLPG